MAVDPADVKKKSNEKFFYFHEWVVVNADGRAVVVVLSKL